MNGNSESLLRVCFRSITPENKFIAVRVFNIELKKIAFPNDLKRRDGNSCSARYELIVQSIQLIGPMKRQGKYSRNCRHWNDAFRIQHNLEPIAAHLRNDGVAIRGALHFYETKFFAIVLNAGCDISNG